jgi:deoxyribodipyrimidine photo-lyase
LLWTSASFFEKLHYQEKIQNQIKMPKVSIFWFRRDLRLNDNAGFYHALKCGYPVLPIFIFDKNILDKLPKKDARVDFLHSTLSNLKAELENFGSTLDIRYGNPVELWKQLLSEKDIAEVYTNHDYEQYAIKRDEEIQVLLKRNSIEFNTFKDHVIFEKFEVTKDDGLPYTVFTPYSKKWKAKLKTQISLMTEEANGTEVNVSYFFKPYPNEKYFSNLHQTSPVTMLSQAEMDFERTDIKTQSPTVKRKVIINYDKTRNFPANDEGTSRLGVHFRHGTISIRDKARKGQILNETYLNELIWRDFYAQILFHFPHVEKNAFREKYEHVEWRYDEDDFKKWCEGKTGYPIVDAGMRELNATGHMHNRVRMITASFLTKHLMIDWRWGEAYFAEKLLDFDLASNNGGWQWAAGCGTDAAPYFRIFNPYTQREKFDKNWEYVKRWVPEYETDKYPEAIVEHKFARQRALDTYKAGLAGR